MDSRLGGIKVVLWLGVFMGQMFFCPDIRAQSPGDVSSNIRLWVKASEGGVNWTDASGNGVTLTMDGTVNTGTTMNFNPANSFDGTAHFDTNLSINYGTYEDVSVLAVYNPTINNTGGVWGEDNLGWDRFILAGQDINVNAGVSNGAGMNLEPTLFTVGTTILSSVIMDNGNTSTVHVQGEQKISFNSNHTGTSANLEIGAIGDDSYKFDGRIAEIIVYSELLASSDREKLETYLGIKYGITLSHDYYSTAYDGSNAGSTTIFDVSNGYANDIAGIGREDNESLEQTRSKSENSDAVVTIGSADDLGDAEYLVWGNDNGALTETDTGVPPEISQMLERKWKISETGDVGTISISFDLSDISSVVDNELFNFTLVIDDTEDLSSPISLTKATSLASNVVTFENIDVADGQYLVLGTSVDAAPGDVSTSMALWLKANAGVTDSAVSAWADQSGNGNDAAQTTPGKRPTLVSEGFNFNPVLSFDGIDDMLDVPYDAGINGDNLTIFSVHRLQEDNNDYRSPFSSRNDDGSGQKGYMLYVHFDGEYEFWTGVNGIGGGTWHEFVQAFSPLAETQLFAVDFTANTTGTGEESFYLDGTTLSTTSAAYYVANDSRPYRVGAGANEGTDGDFFWVGDIAEQIVFEGVLTLADRHKVDSYLAIKYGLSLTHDFYSIDYDGANAGTTTVYDIDNGYGEDVAGIVREDSEALYQTSSRSENSGSILTITGPSDLGDTEYLLWGNDGQTGTINSDLPESYDERLRKVWFFDETGEVGTVTIRFDLSQLGNRSSNPADYAVLINSSPIFLAATTHINGATITDNVLTFTNLDIADNSYITLALPSIGSPGNVSDGLDLWFSGNEVSTEIDGTLDSWSDQSGNQNHGQPATLDRPILELSDKVNFNSYVSFIDDEVGQVSLGSNTNQSTFFAVVNTSTDGSDIFELDNDTSPRLSVESGVYRVDSDAAFVSSTTSGNWNIVGMVHGGATAKELFVDGVLEDSDASAIAIAASAHYNLFTNFTGEVAEAIHYDNALNTTNRRQVESYLAIKYGITLDITSQDYLDGSGGTILDKDAFTGYLNNIAGIGKANADSGDDAQGLNQVQSKSINTNALMTVSSASSLGDGEYLLWASDNATALATLTESAPSHAIANVSMVLGRKWKITETGDIGSVSISFDLTGVTSVSDKELANYTLVIDDNEDMSSPLSQTKPTSLASNEITFENIDVADGQYIVLGTSVDAAPSNVSANIRLWVKASQGGVNWTDVSGNGVSLTMDGTVNVGTTMNFNPTNSFDGSAHFDTDLSINHGTYGDVSILAVYSPNVNNSGGVWGEDNLGWDRFIVDGDDDTIDAGVSNGGGMTFEPSLFVVGTTTLSSVILDNGNTSTVHVQGDPKLSFTSNQVGTSTNLEIGAIGDDNYLFDGRIAEIIVYSDLLTSVDREKLETYLGIKYGVTLSHNYYSTAYDGSNAGSTTIFDVSNGYANDIAGIGREDNESLVQNKSKSENTDAVITIGSADDLGDVEYLVWGNDDGALTETATDLPTGISQMLTRKWIASETGDLGGVEVQFDLTGLSFTGTTATDFALVIDGDAVFNDGDETMINASSFDSDVVTFNSVDFSDGTVFTLATSVSTNLNEISNDVGDYEVTSSCPVFDGSSFIDVRDNNNRVVYAINPNGNDLGATCWGVRIRASGSASDDLTEGEDYFLDRNFYISPTTQPSTPVSLKLYILNEEIDDIRAKLAADGKASGSNVTEYLQDFLKITKQDGTDLDPLTVDGSGNISSITPTANIYSNIGYSLEFEVNGFSELILGTDSSDPTSTLPVELASFNASLLGSLVEVEWKTLSELNNDYFVIQRSINGIDFESIGEVSGNGTINTPTSYEFVDTDPYFGVSYYRLKQIDFDGNSETFDAELVTNNSVGWDVVFFPNPTDKSNINFRISSLNQSSIQLYMYDMTGNLVVQQMIKTDVGVEDNALILNQDISPGLYHITLIYEGHVITRKLKIN